MKQIMLRLTDEQTLAIQRAAASRALPVSVALAALIAGATSNFTDFSAFDAIGRADETTLNIPQESAVRFWSRVDKSGECWEWSGARLGQGYGSVRIAGRHWLTHRISWVITHGPIPPGLRVCHKCDNPPCCNPDHLFLGTDAENIHDAMAKGRFTVQMAKRGELNSQALLNDASVREIRRLYSEGVPQRAIAERLGVSRSCIQGVVLRRRWAHVED